MGWENKRLNELIEVKDGTHDSPKYVTEGYPLVTSKNIVQGKLNLQAVNYISLQDYEKINNRSKVDIGDIIMPMIGTIGNPHLVLKQPDFAIKNVALFKANESTLGSKLLLYMLNSSIVKDQLKDRSRGGTQKFVSLKNLREIKIPLPPLEEQKRIVELLDQAQSLIDKRKEQIELMDQLIQSLFYDMFGDPVTNPMGWDISVLEKVLDKPVTYGILKPETHVQNGVTMLRIVDIKNGVVDTTNAHKVSTQLSQQYQRTILEGNELVISLVGTLGLTAMITTSLKGANVHRNLGVVQFNMSLVSRAYFYYLSKLPSFTLVISKLRKGGNQPLLNLGSLNKLPLPVPPITLQNKFAQRVEKIEAQKQAMTASLAELKDNFNAISQRAFKGEL